MRDSALKLPGGRRRCRAWPLQVGEELMRDSALKLVGPLHAAVGVLASEKSSCATAL